MVLFHQTMNVGMSSVAIDPLKISRDAARVNEGGGVVLRLGLRGNDENLARSCFEILFLGAIPEHAAFCGQQQRYSISGIFSEEP